MPFCRTAALLATLALFTALPAIAAEKKKADPRDELNQTMQDIEKAEERKKQLQQEEQKMTEEMESLQKMAVDTAAKIQSSESQLSTLEEKRAILETQQKEKREALEQRQKQLKKLVDAALKLSAAPPEAVMMMPGDFDEAAKTARALQSVSDAVRHESKSLQSQLDELKDLKAKVEKNRQQQLRKRDELEKNRGTMNEQLEARQRLQQQKSQERKQEIQNLEALTKKSHSLKDLITTIEASEKKRQAEAQKQAERPKPPAIKRSFAEAKGSVHLPVAGKIIRRFGVAQGKNETSRGLTVQTRANAQVTAPFDGEVVFTGPFMDYGKLVILRHSDDFHTLIAGIENIKVATGQFLLEGEPIGAMGDNQPANELYLELRKNNQPVDPATWLGDAKNPG